MYRDSLSTIAVDSRFLLHRFQGRLASLTLAVHHPHPSDLSHFQLPLLKSQVWVSWTLVLPPSQTVRLPIV